MFRLLRDPFWKGILRLRCIRKIEAKNVFLPLVTDMKGIAIIPFIRNQSAIAQGLPLIGQNKKGASCKQRVEDEFL
jgi:hypothetical protein